MVRYYQIWVASLEYHGYEALTYHTDTELVPGSLVRVPLRNKNVAGIVLHQVSKPSFNTKPITELITSFTLPAETLQLISWMAEYYPSPIGSIVQQFIPKDLSSKHFIDDTPTQRLSHKHVTTKPPVLTAEQMKTLQQINAPGSYLIHGITGSGKTRIYQEIAQRVVRAGKSVIVLTPEISLTTQLLKNFEAIFPGQVIVVHSRLTQSQRLKIWVQSLTSKTPLIIIGARSALFGPLKNIGLIVVDEAHESAYKQEQAPYYHAVRVAAKLAQLYRSYFVLGSATLSVVDYYVAEQKNTPIISMSHLATSNKKAKDQIEVVDIKDRHNYSKSYILSDPLIAAISEALGKKEQVLLFLNRRGTARTVLCQNCGWQAFCPHCDIPLIYHGDSHSLRCHTCQHYQPAVSVCPVCSHHDLLFKTVGTKAIVDEAHKLFPKASIQRFDNDNLKSERFESHYENILRGNIDIIIGTQTLAKGLDLPNLSVVGIITADTALYSPEYTSQEKMYQLVSQVVGRVGRGHRDGKAVIQTYAPGSQTLLSAINRDWTNFYHKELIERSQFMFPPYCYILKLYCRRATSKSAEKAAMLLAESLRIEGLRIQINGPAPAFHEKKSNRFEWQLIIKSKHRTDLLKVIPLLPSGWLYDIDPVSLL
jgi:primosomal protein N' (replication factor Y) (superfamily II helicase)